MASYPGLVLSGVIAAPPQELSATITGYAGVSVVGPSPAAVVAGSGQLTRSTPRPSIPAHLAGVRTYSFADDLYDKFYLNPTKIDVGNLTGTITREVELWNAYRVPKVCQAVGKDGMDGIDVDVEETGFTLGALQSRTFNLTIQMDGPPIIEGHLDLDFGSAVVLTVVVVGRRIVAWVWLPKSPQNELLEWLTDIIEARDGSEQRARLRNAPRQSWEVSVLARTPAECAAIETALYGWQGRSWAMPVWPEQVEMQGPLATGATGVNVDTTRADHRPAGLVMLWQSPQVNETLQVSGVSSGRLDFVLPTSVAFGPGPILVMPVRTTRIVGAARRDDHVSGPAEFGARFLVVDNVEFVGDPAPVQYKGYDVLLDPLLAEGDMVQRQIERPMTVLDYGVGTCTIDAPRTYSTAGYEMRWRLRTQAEVWAMRKWLHRRAGRVAPFWMPSWRGDLELMATVGAAEKSIRVRDVSFSRLLYGCPVRRHIMVELTDGAQFFFEVLGAVTGNPGEDVLTIDGFIGRVTTPADVRRISWLSLHRLNTDAVQLQHDRAGVARLAVPVKEIAQ